jgi:hypothetical protein
LRSPDFQIVVGDTQVLSKQQNEQCPVDNALSAGEFSDIAPNHAIER